MTAPSPTTLPLPAPRPALGWTEFVLAPVGWLVLTVAGGLGLTLAGVRPGTVLLTGVSIGGLFALTGLLLALRVRSWAPLRLHRPGLRAVLLGIGAGLGVRLLAVPIGLAWFAISGDTAHPQQNLIDATTGGVGGMVAMLVLGGVVGPLAEELLYRGVAYSAMRRHGPVVAALASSAVFALLHVHPLVVATAFVLGLVNAVLVERTGSLWPAVASHVTFNLGALVLAAAFL
jgi:uncharacterized protein